MSGPLLDRIDIRLGVTRAAWRFRRGAW
ncbi:MAG TPA: hypothetical protein PK428_03765 [Phycicoccus sp.]|nr:hypothetical protein [Phycicoccus sp.]